MAYEELLYYEALEYVNESLKKQEKIEELENCVKVLEERLALKLQESEVEKKKVWWTMVILTGVGVGIALLVMSNLIAADEIRALREGLTILGEVRKTVRREEIEEAVNIITTHQKTIADLQSVSSNIVLTKLDNLLYGTDLDESVSHSLNIGKGSQFTGDL